MDTANLTVVNYMSHDVTVQVRSGQCYNCSFNQLGVISPSLEDTYTVDTKWDVQYNISCASCTQYVTPKDPHLSCVRSFNFREGGNYTLFAQSNLSSSECICRLVANSYEGDNNIPVYVALGILVLLIMAGIGYSFLKKTWLYRKVFVNDEIFTEDLGSTTGDPRMARNLRSQYSQSTSQLVRSSESVPVVKQRLKSLDAFRGLSLIIMIFVNYGGGKYWYFNHSPWNGLTVADLVFPWFIFIMGTSISVAYKNVHNRPVSKAYFLWRVWKRAITLFALGLLLNSIKMNGNLGKLRIPGVLQRIAITFGVTASIEIILSRPIRNVRWTVLIDQIYLLPHWIINLAFVTLWLTITFAMDVPSCGRGYIGPGGDNALGTMRNCSGGAAGFIDWWLFGNDHRYCHPTFQKVYHTKNCYDPEGILGSFNSIFLCYLGLMAGKILILMSTWQKVLKRFLIWFVILGAIALVLTMASTNQGFIPINKNLWSLSYVLAMGSMAFFLFGLMYWVIDILHVWSGEPLIYPGMNSIVIYICHEVFKPYFPISWTVPDNHASQLAMDVWGTTIWLVVSYLLYRKKIFISV